MGNPLHWLAQWPIRAAVLLIVAWLPLGVELDGFLPALTAAGLIGLLGTLLTLPLKALLALPWAIASLGGLLFPVSWLFNWLINVVLFALAAMLLPAFRLRFGLASALLGAVIYGLLSALILRAFGLQP
jgi:putative membrane protein